MLKYTSEFILILFMYFVIFQGEDPRYAVMHLAQMFYGVFYICRNKIFNIEIEGIRVRSLEMFIQQVR